MARKKSKRRRSSNLEKFIDPILARDQGVPYDVVLETFGITANQFCSAVQRWLVDMAEIARGSERLALEKILDDEERKTELFRMPEAFIRTEYLSLMTKKRASTRHFQLPAGVRLHPANIENLVYVALSVNNPRLALHDRQEVVNGVAPLPRGLGMYFCEIGLASILQDPAKGSPLAILRIFDTAYRDRTGYASLFDLSQPAHLHEWGDTFQAPASYWRNHSNVQKAVFHVLSESAGFPGLESRTNLVAWIKGLPMRLQDYFESLGLSGLMDGGFGKDEAGSPLAVLKAFDSEYKARTGDRSLFDLSQAAHLHEWGDRHETGRKWKATQGLWRNQSYADRVVYHVLTEDIPALSSHDRGVIIDAFKGMLPTIRFLWDHSLGGVVNVAYENSPLKVVRGFDREFMRTTDAPSLFDATQPNYLDEKALLSKNKARYARPQSI